MKLKIILAASLMLITANSFCGDGSKNKPLRIFFIGNSNTYMWGWYPKDNPDMAADPALPKRLKEMALKAPRPVYINYTFKMKGGSNLEWQWLNGAQDSIKNGHYDYVVLNDHSTATYAYPDKFIKYSGLFDSLCKVYGAKAIFFMGWPDDNEWALRRDTIIRSYDRLAKQLNAELAPFGRAWELIEKRKPTLNLYQDDLHHPNELGVYMNTCVLYSIITNSSPVDVNYKFLMNWAKPVQEDYEVIKMAAWDACKDRHDPLDEMKLSGELIEQHNIKLTWNKPKGTSPAFYAVYQNATAVFYTTDTTYQIINAKPDMFHTYAVLGMKSDSIPLYNSNGISMSVPDVDKPSAPQGLKITYQSSNYVQIGWTASVDNVKVTQYIVYLDDVEYNRTPANGIQLSGLQIGKTYNIRVAASDDIPNISDKSDVLTFTYTASALEKEKNIYLYPNPTHDRIIVTSAKGTLIRMYSINGILCYEILANNDEMVVDVSGLYTGVYIVEISSATSHMLRKLIIE